MIEYTTSMNYIDTNADGEQFEVSAIYPNTWTKTEAESVDAATAAYEKAGKTADQLLSIKTVAYEDIDETEGYYGA